MHNIIVAKKDEIVAICRKYDVERLEIFGSAARGTDFDPAQSDIDFLVLFSLSWFPGVAKRYDGMRRDLHKELGRKVDLFASDTIRNPYRKASIDRDREVIYER